MAVAGTIAVFFFVLFMALGTWQVQRRAWKLDLIARVEQRVHAPATPAPGPAQWPNVTVASDEYRHVTATGRFLDGSQTLVQAVTDLGAGYWVLTPLRLADGSIVLINRGFVPADDRNRVQPGSLASPSESSASASGSSALPSETRAPADASAVARAGGDSTSLAHTSTVTGLLRITEPRGAFLRHNNPGANKWYSRDVQAIAAARGLTHVAPYFIDAEGPTSDVAEPPRNGAGLTDSGAGFTGNGAGVTGDRAGTTGNGAEPPRNGAGLTGNVEHDMTQGPSARNLAPARGAGGGGRSGDSGGSTPAAVLPTPGLTVVHFHNSHLVYAITWYTLALLVGVAIILGLRKQ
jgi:surfeit locus 1 family protein